MKLLLTISLFLAILLANKHSTAEDYYWVGGSGDWSDITHWAKSSGGTIYHIQYPTPLDNVIFDANSFSETGQKVSVNIANATCRSMTWTTAQFNPTLSSGLGTLKIYGSLTLIPNMSFGFTMPIYFESESAGMQITTFGKKLPDVYFQGVSGTWDLQDDFLCGKFIHANGIVNTNNKTITCSVFNTQTSSQPRTLNVGTSHFNASSWSLSEVNLTTDFSQTIINMSGNNFSGGIGIFYNVVSFSGAASISGSNSYNLVTIPGNGSIGGMNIFDRLELSEGRIYTFAAGSTQTIGTEIIATGQCEKPIFFFSSSKHNQATIYKSSGLVEVDHVTMRDINVQGGANFIANNVVDLGNLSGWTLNHRAITPLYWVGGSGEWGDVAHWSFSSGGIGGACVPSAINDVYFDENSFTSANESVGINEELAYCRNIDWTGVGNFTNNGASGFGALNIFGSLTFVENMNWQYQGSTNFAARTMGHTVTSAGNAFQNNVTFDGKYGSWELTDSIVLGSSEVPEFSLKLSAGKLSTKGNNVYCSKFNSSPGDTTRMLELDSTIFTCDYQWSVNSNGLTFDAGTSLIKMRLANATMTCGDSLDYYDVWFVADKNDARFSGFDCSFHKVEFCSNAAITGDNTYDTLRLAAGKQYLLSPASTQTIIDSLDANGTCSDNIYILSAAEGQLTSISKESGEVVVNYAVIRDIQALGGANFTANFTLNWGNNPNWTINENLSRDLHWVGNSGSWSDESHWSLISGGGGGECLPTPIDNVIFDENSFSLSNAVVEVGTDAIYCHDMDWHGSDGFPSFSGQTVLSMYGSMRLIADMSFGFNGRIQFLSNETGETIITAENIIPCYMHFMGLGGGWEITDPLNTSSMITLVNGVFNTNNFNVECLSFQSNFFNQRDLYLGTSEVTVNSGTFMAWSVYSNNLNLDADSSTIIFPNSGAGIYTYNGNLWYNKVLFEATTGKNTIYTYNNNTNFRYVNFLSNGDLKGDNSFDSLFFVPNKTYVLDAGKRQTINNYLHARGNNCFPLTIRSNSTGGLADIYKEDGFIYGDFILMRDLRGVGGASFYAGSNSTDMNSSNENWIFDDMPGYIYGFQRDSILILGEEITLVADNFNGGPHTTYEWQTGSTELTYATNSAEKCILNAVYGVGCHFPDTINVFFAKIDSISCYGLTDAAINILYDEDYPYSFEWSTGATTPNIENLSSGNYTITITDELGSQAIRTFEIEEPDEIAFSQIDSVDILCNNSNNGSISVVASGGTAPYEYYLNDGTAQNTGVFTSLQAGKYSVSAIDANGCFLIGDSIEIINPELITVDITTIDLLCADVSNGSITIVPSGGVGIFEYSIDNGLNYFSNSGNFTNLPSGEYNISVRDENQCEKGNLSIELLSPSPLEISGLMIDKPCVNEADGSISFSASGGEGVLSYTFDSYTHNNSEFSNLTNGIYTLIVTDINGCTLDSVLSIDNAPSPIINLVDTITECDGTQIELDAGSFSSYLWNSGATTQRITVDESGNYNVTVRNDDNCPASDTIYVNYEVPQYESVTIILQPSQDGKDALIHSGLPDNNFGDSEDFSAISTSWSGSPIEMRSLLSFDLSTIPEDAIILSASLSLRHNSSSAYAPHSTADGTNKSKLKLITQNWEEQTVTWSNQPQTTDVNAIILEETSSSDEDKLNINVRKLIRKMKIEPTNYHGFMLVLDSSTGNRSMVFASGDNSSVALHPELEIVYGIKPEFMTNNYCLGTETEFVATHLPASTISISWDFDDNTGLNYGNSQLHTYNQGGEYNVSMVVNHHCAIDTIEDLVRIYPLPALDLGQDTSICEGDSLRLVVSDEYETFEWQNTDSVSNTFTVFDSGLYKLTVSQFGCFAEDSILININSLPETTLNDTVTICLGDTATLDPGVFPSFDWSTGANTQTIRAWQEDWYSVIVGDVNSCYSIDSTFLQTIISNPTSEISFISSCINTNSSFAILNIPDDVDSVRWDFGVDNATSTDLTTTYIYESGGEYQIELLVFQKCIIDTVRQTIDIYPSPNVTLGNDTSICSGEYITFDVGEHYDTYQWQLSDSINATFTTNAAGEYWVEVTENGCVGADTVILSINQSPVFSLGNDTILCANSTILLYAPTGYNSYNWSTGSDSLSTIINTSGEYWLELFDENNCSSTDFISVEYRELLEIDSVVASNVVCNGSENGAISIYISDADCSFSIDNGNNFQSLPVFNNLLQGTYYPVVLDDFGCKLHLDELFILEPNIITISNITSNVLCFSLQTGSINLSVSGGTVSSDYRYNWSNGAETKDITSLAAGEYTISVTDDNNCLAEQSFVITSPEQIVIELLTTDATCLTIPDGTIDINLYGGVPEFDIVTSDSSGWTVQNTNELYVGKYIVEATDANGCISTDTVVIKGNICDMNLTVPNIFTPDGDGYNDEFEIDAQSIAKFNCKIYNRWGRLIYEWNDANEGWNGKIDNGNSEASSGVYFYIITIETTDKQKVTQNGNVHLVRH